MLELSWMLSTPLLPLLPVPIRSRVVPPDKVLSVGQIELSAQSAGDVEYTTASQQRDKTPLTYVQYMAQKNWWGGSSNAGALENAEYPFISIGPG